jgi:hypothetical protein
VGHRRIVLVLSALIVVAAAISVVVVVHGRHHAAYFCADVGIPNAPVVATPDGALAAFVAKDGGHASAWKRIGSASDQDTYARTTTVGAGSTLQRIEVRRNGASWQVDGGCV